MSAFLMYKYTLWYCYMSGIRPGSYVIGRSPSGTTDITAGGQTVVSNAQVAKEVISTIKTQLKLARQKEPTDKDIAIEIATLIMRIEMFASLLGKSELTLKIQSEAKKLVDTYIAESKNMSQHGVQSGDYLTKLAILYVKEGVWLINGTDKALSETENDLLHLENDSLHLKTNAPLNF